MPSVHVEVVDDHLVDFPARREVLLKLLETDGVAFAVRLEPQDWPMHTIRLR
jgi:hypothetical protein